MARTPVPQSFAALIARSKTPGCSGGAEGALDAWIGAVPPTETDLLKSSCGSSVAPAAPGMGCDCVKSSCGRVVAIRAPGPALFRWRRASKTFLSSDPGPSRLHLEALLLCRESWDCRCDRERPLDCGAAHTGSRSL